MGTELDAGPLVLEKTVHDEPNSVRVVVSVTGSVSVTGTVIVDVLPEMVEVMVEVAERHGTPLSESRLPSAEHSAMVVVIVVTVGGSVVTLSLNVVVTELVVIRLVVVAVAVVVHEVAMGKS